MVGGKTVTLFLIAAAITGRITQWDHYPHYGGGNCIVVMDDMIMAGTSGGLLFSHYSPEEDKLIADSGWTSPGILSYDRVSDIAIDQQGNVWVSMNGGGIDVFSPGGDKTHFNQIDGLPLNLGVNQTIPDTVVYAATTQGLCIREFGYFEIWDTYETGGGLPSDNINCILSSDSGLYAGTTAGLVFLPRSAPPDDPESWILQDIDQTSIIDIQWHGDTLWAATGENLFRKAPDLPWERDASFPGTTIASISTGQGSLAVGCTNRCYVLTEEGWTLYDGNLDGNALTGIVWYQDRLCGVLANTYSNNRASGSGIALLLPDSTWRRTFPDFGPISNDLRSCTLLPDGSLWATSNRNGASVLSDGQWTNLNIYLTSRSQCFAVCPSGNGAFISSIGFGVDWLEWENGEVTEKLHITSDDGMVNDRVFHAAEGGRNTVWFAHRTLFESEESGVSRLSWSPGDFSSVTFAVISGSNGLPSKEVNCVFPEGSRYAWAGTDEGLAYIDADRRMVLETWNSQNGLPSSLVNSVYMDRTGTVYVGTASGLAEVSEDGAFSIDAVDYAVNQVLCDGLGSVWLATSEGLRRYFPSTGNLESYTSFNSPLPEGVIYSFALDSGGGYLWMATDHGMWRGKLETGLDGEGSGALLYPNPFIPGRGDVLGISGVPDEPAVFTIFDLTGNPVFEYSSQGRDDFAWDGRTADGLPAASGVYMVFVESGSYSVPLLKIALVR